MCRGEFFEKFARVSSRFEMSDEGVITANHSSVPIPRAFPSPSPGRRQSGLQPGSGGRWTIDRHGNPIDFVPDVIPGPHDMFPRPVDEIWVPGAWPGEHETEQEVTVGAERVTPATPLFDIPPNFPFDFRAPATSTPRSADVVEIYDNDEAYVSESDWET